MLRQLLRDAVNMGQKRRGKRKKRASKTPKAPASDTPEPLAFERMKDFTRALIAVRKSELAPEPRRNRPDA